MLFDYKVRKFLTFTFHAEIVNALINMDRSVEYRNLVEEKAK